MTFIYALLVSIPMAFLNYVIARRKSEKPLVFALWSILPVINGMITLYLLSLEDKDMKEKIDQIHRQVSGELY